MDTFFLWSLRLSKGGKKKVLKNVKKLSLRRYGTCLCLHAKNEANTVNVKVEVEVGVPPAARHALSPS